MGIARPHIILSAAISLDGKIAAVGGDSSLSSPTDRRRVHMLRSRADAILIGRGTQENDDPLLTSRVKGGRNPLRVVLDSRGAISSESKILRTSDQIPTIIAVAEEVTEENMLRLKKAGSDVVVCGQGRVDIEMVLALLYERGVRLLLVEGGGVVNWHLLSKGLVDEVIVTVTPYLVGGEAAASLVRGQGFWSVAESSRLNLRSVSRHGDEVILEYVVHHK